MCLVRPYSNGMDAARPLHSVFADLAGERGYAEASGLGPDEVLAANGHPDLPEGLVAEAVVNYADTAPVEVAEHLAPYVRANSAVPQSASESSAAEPDWYGLLTTAPAVPGLTDGHDVLDAEAGALTAEASVPAAPDAGRDLDIDFGHGHRGPLEDDPSGLASPAEGGHLPSWPVTPDPGPEFDAGADLDAALPARVEDTDATTDDEPDPFDAG